MCLDMNDFYLGLVPEEERCRVESLEPFDEYEVSCVHVFLFCEVVVVSLLSMFNKIMHPRINIDSVSVCPQEWHQKCSHYFILTASRGSLMAQALLLHAPGSYHFISLSLLPTKESSVISISHYLTPLRHIIHTSVRLFVVKVVTFV